MSYLKNISLISFSILMLLSSCSEDEKPPKFMEKDQMIDLLFDMSLAEGTRAKARTTNNKEKTNIPSINNYYQMVFEKHGITSVEFDSISAYYTRHPEVYKEIFKEVLDRLNKLEAEEQKIKSNPDKKQKKAATEDDHNRRRRELNKPNQ